MIEMFMIFFVAKKESESLFFPGSEQFFMSCCIFDTFFLIQAETQWIFLGLKQRQIYFDLSRKLLKWFQS